MKSRKHQQLSRIDRLQPEAVARELEGLIEAGMRREALRLARAILEKKRLTPDEFFQVIRTFGVFSDFHSFRKAKPKIEAAYRRQSKNFRRAARPEMVDLYGSLKEWKAAAKYLSIKNPRSLGEFVFGMDALLNLDRLRAAEILAARCRKALAFVTDDFERAMLVEALSSFLARTRQWDEAIELCQTVSLNQPLRQNALSRTIQLYLACALESVDISLWRLTQLQNDKETALFLPGIDSKLTQDAKKELLKFKRGIEKLLPERARRNLGIVQTN